MNENAEKGCNHKDRSAYRDVSDHVVSLPEPCVTTMSRSYIFDVS
jgi:hypothetical protein